MLSFNRRFVAAVATLAAVTGIVAIASSMLGGPLPGTLPLFPRDNWWNLDISAAPVDPASASYIAFINNGSTRTFHPDFGGDATPGGVATYGFPYLVVDGTLTKRTVQFAYAGESDGVDHGTIRAYPSTRFRTKR